MDKTNSAQMAKLAIKALEDKKAEDVRVIDISEISVLARKITDVSTRTAPIYFVPSVFIL